MRFWIILAVVLVNMLNPQPALAEDVKRKLIKQEDCDIPATGFASSKAKDESECSESCLKQEKCRAYVFISGWNRCFLKDSVRMSKGIVMYGGDIDRSEGRDPTVRSFGMHKDHRGRDLKNISPVKSEDACQQSCLNESKCVGYVWISGYDSCWLKKTKGDPLDKRFYCGVVGL